MYIYINMYIYVYYLHTYTCVCVCVCMCVYIYIYIYIYNASVPFDPLVHLLDTPFQNSPDSQSQEINLNILKTKRAFEVK